MGTRQITDPELATLLVFSFRYALGRHSTAASIVRDLLRSWGHVLQPWAREQIVNDINRAIVTGYAGAGCDVEVWRKVMNEIAGEVKP